MSNYRILVPANKKKSISLNCDPQKRDTIKINSAHSNRKSKSIIAKESSDIKSHYTPIRETNYDPSNELIFNANSSRTVKKDGMKNLESYPRKYQARVNTSNIKQKKNEEFKFNRQVVEKLSFPVQKNNKTESFSSDRHQLAQSEHNSYNLNEKHDYEDEYSKLKEECSQLKSKTQNLKAELKKSENYSKELSRERDELKSETQNLNEELKKSENYSKELSQERDELKSETQNLKEELKKSENYSKELSQERDELKSVQKSNEQEISSLKNQILMLVENNLTVSKELEEKNRELAEVKIKYEKIAKELDIQRLKYKNDTESLKNSLENSQVVEEIKKFSEIYLRQNEDSEKILRLERENELLRTEKTIFGSDGVSIDEKYVSSLSKENSRLRSMILTSKIFGS